MHCVVLLLPSFSPATRPVSKIDLEFNEQTSSVKYEFFPYKKYEGVGGVQGALTLFCGGVAQTCHDEVDGERQEGKVKEEGRDRVKENAPWMTWR